MVKRLMTQTIWLVVLMALWLPAHAGELTAMPDRTSLYEGDVLTLTVKGTTEIDLDLSDMFNFDVSSLPSPDIEKVSPDFDVLSRRQLHNIHAVNGNMVGEITWTYELAPKSTGELTIPALTFKDSVSKPVTIDVKKGNPPDQADTNRDSFIELTADKSDVYVQEQLILTVRLFFRGNLIRGELSEPEHPNAIIEPLGKQREFSSDRNGVRYRVVERRYAVFPQKPGPLNLPAIRFEGQARDTNGSLKFLRDSAALFEVPVKAIPAQFSGQTWLPATNLTLAEAGMPPTLNLKTGDNLTRTLSLKAAGLPSEALPPLPENVPDGLRSYPEEPKRDTSVGADGITSTLTQTRAIVPVKAGNLTLPAIRIPWWDTDSDSEKVAVIPAQTLNITLAESAAESAAEGATVPATNPAKPPGTDSNASASGTRNPVNNNRFWQWVSLALAGIWVLTMLAWWRTRRLAPQTSASRGSGDGANESAVFKQLLNCAKEGSASTHGLFVSWANLRMAGHNFRSAGDVFHVYPKPDLEAEFSRLQAHLFSRDPSGVQKNQEPWNGNALTEALKQARESMGESSPKAGLPPLYPDTLRVSGPM